MKYLLCSILICVSGFAFAQTPLSGGIYNNTTLTLANSPYAVTGDLVVFDGVKLTIEPGVEIMVDSNKKIEVRGQISALGTAAQHIYIHGHKPLHGKNFWMGFVFVGTTNPLGSGSQADFNYCDVSDARYCFDMDIAYHGPYRFRNGTFTYNDASNRDGGMGGVLFDSCIISHNVDGISGLQFGGTVSNCIFDANGDGVSGVDRLINCRFTNHTGVAIRPAGYTSNCEAYNNNIGVEGPFNNSNNTFINNKIKNNITGVRLLTYFNGSINFTGNEICNNSQFNIDLSTKNNADLSNNCWCLSDSISIRYKMLDGYVYLNNGIVNFMPFNANCSNLVATGAEVVNENIPSLTISPNPSAHNMPVKVEWHGISDKNIRLIVRNTLGQHVPYDTWDAGTGYSMLRLDTSIPGIYFITAYDVVSGIGTTKRIIVQE